MTDEPTRTHAPDPDATAVAGPSQPSAAPESATIPGYELVRELGRGAMGVVFEAKQSGLNRTVALKMVLAGPWASASARARFLIEAEAVAALEHPHIVRVFAFGEHDGHPFLAMEYLPGGTLADRVQKNGPLPAREAAAVAAKLARAVAHAHSRGVVHRDIKPGNILLTADGEPRLADFGLAKVGRSDMTATGQILGTPAYMAPEQAAGKTSEVGTHSDVYALGAVLYDLLTGHPPFKADSAAVTLQKVLTAEPDRPRSLNPSVPRDLETICLKCLRKEPGKRYATADALADDLERFLAGRPIEARPVGRIETAWKWVRRNRLVTALLAAVFLSLAAGVAVSLVFIARQQILLGRQQVLLKEAAHREGGLAVEKAAALFDDADQFDHAQHSDQAGQLWAARGLELLERGGATAEEQQFARTQLSLWGQHARSDEFHTPRVSLHSPRPQVLPDGTVVVAEEDGPGQTALARYDPHPGRLLARFPLGPDSRTGTHQFRASLEHGRLLVFLSSVEFRDGGGPEVPAELRLDGYRLYDLRSGNLLRQATRPPGDRRWDRFRRDRSLVSPDLGTVLVRGQNPRSAQLWDTTTDKLTDEIDLKCDLDSLLREPAGLRGHAGNRPHASLFGADGRTLAIRGDDGVVRVWEAPSGAGPVLIRHPPPQPGVKRAFSSADGRGLVTVGDDGTVRQWDVRTGKETQPPLAFDRPDIEAGAFDAVRNLIEIQVVTSRDKSIPGVLFRSQPQLWDLTTRSRLAVKGDRLLGLSPDRRLVSNNMGDRLLYAETGVPAGPPLPAKLDAAQYTPDGKFLLLEVRGLPLLRLQLYSVGDGRRVGPTLNGTSYALAADPDRVVVCDPVHHHNADGRGGNRWHVRNYYLRPLEGPAGRIREWAEWMNGGNLDANGRFAPWTGVRAGSTFNGDPAFPPWR